MESSKGIPAPPQLARSARLNELTAGTMAPRRYYRARVSGEPARSPLGRDARSISSIGPLTSRVSRTGIRTWLDTILDIPCRRADPRTAYDNGRRAGNPPNDYHTGARLREGSGSSSTWRCASRAATAASGPIGGRRIGSFSPGRPARRRKRRSAVGRAAMGRKFVSGLPGRRPGQAEIRGHRRTYGGALPGRIVPGHPRGCTMNPVRLLDESTRSDATSRGDPAAACSSLDPAQNHPSETITSRSSSTCPTWCSWPRRTARPIPAADRPEWTGSAGRLPEGDEGSPAAGPPAAPQLSKSG